MARFQEISLDVKKSYLSTAWKTFGTEFTDFQITAIQFQTAANAPFYLSYRTYNEERGWLPYVSSMDDDYAGFGLNDTRGVQSIGIQVKESATGAKLDHTYIVMYRARVGGHSLPWVSNARPDLMNQVYEYFHLDGELDTSSGNAGLPGADDVLKHFEIRIFKDNGLDNSDSSIGGEAGASLSYMVDGNWSAFDKSAMSSHMDGIKIQTSTNKNYYLLYKTWNEGKDGYYPAVKSTENDYAGSPGKPIQRLSIQAFRNDGTKLTSGVVVMYRAYVDGKWLPWVSNADPEWMRAAQTKYSLGGTLDTGSSYAGIGGKNIGGVEIRIFEDDSSNPGSGSFTGAEVNLSMRYMANSTSNWTSFSKSVLASPMDGIEIRTSGKDYYLSYKTWNEGKSGYYPAVKSTENDYAGSPGKPIQRLSIQVFRNDGTKLTSGVVVMYRAYVDGRWLPWVSNADPEWMSSVQSQYNLGGTLDTKGAYAGISGKNIAGIEIRAFEGNTTSLPEEDLPGEESAASLSYLSNGTWKTFSKSVMASPIDGIKIQTSAGKPYYLLYKTQNAGKSGFYPAVKSTENDYAGSPGKAIQKLSIYAYQNDGTKLTTGVVVMYRAYVDGRWLPWVSNADPEWMRAAQSKYNLDGTLDTGSYYAGIGGKDIAGVEIRVFEESTSTVTPTGKHKIINAPFISQNGLYPTGCESVTTTMALQHAGIPITVDDFIDHYLDRSGFPFDPNLTFGGNPRSSNGYGCYAPVIKKALDKILTNKKYEAEVLYQVPLETLCAQYIDHDIPVILWATMGMRPSRTKTWDFDGRRINWVQPEHCLLLVGYDDGHYIFNDPQSSQPLTYYSKASVEAAYKAQSCQAIIIKEVLIVPDPPEPETKKYKYGSIINPKNNLEYPIREPMCKREGTYIGDPNYWTLDNVIHLRSDPQFDPLKFIIGFALEDTLKEPIKNFDGEKLVTLIGSTGSVQAAGISFIAGSISAFCTSWSTPIYIDVYFNTSKNGEREASVYLGSEQINSYFHDDVAYAIKTLLSSVGTDNPLRVSLVSDSICRLLKDVKGIDYGIDLAVFDLEFNFDFIRKHPESKYVSELWIDANGEYRESPIIYPSERFYILRKVTTLGPELERFDITDYFKKDSEVPKEYTDLFETQFK